MTLLDMVRDYQSLLERKEELADEVKANNALIEEAKAKNGQAGSVKEGLHLVE